jgi:hypothetical protein
MKHYQWLIFAFCLILLVSCGTQTVPTMAEPVTINGSDGVGGTIDPINVSATYNPRGATVAQLHPGTKVTMLRREGDGVLIRTSDGVEGWVTYWFINGLKKE